MTRIGNKCALGLGLAIALAPVGAVSAYDFYSAVLQKFNLISSDRLLAGARIDFSPAELNAYAQHEVPPGVRNPKLQLAGRGEVTGSAMVDFGKVRRAQGDQPGWLMSKLLDGERPVSVTVRIGSSGGTAKVDVLRVDVSGIEIDGKVLDFLIQNVLLPLYPNAMVGRTFDLSHRIDRLEVSPAGVSVVIGR
jgi:hypothetical protein